VQVRTVAAILVWFVVVLLLLNRYFRSEWLLPISIVLTVIAVVIYFSPRLRKKSQKQAESTSTEKQFQLLTKATLRGLR
jgi:general stress protein CsbA